MGDKNEAINHIVSRCSKLAQTRYDWMGKVFHWELCKKLEFDHTTKLYTHKPESI